MSEVVFDAARGLCSGLLVGALFVLAGAPIPAPPTIGGVLGVAGVAAGWAFALHVKGLLQ